MLSLVELQAVFAILGGEMLLFQVTIFLVAGVFLAVVRSLLNIFARRPMSVWFKKE